MAALIQKIWDVSWDMRDYCNKELYVGNGIQQQIMHSLVNNQIIAFYRGGAQQLPHDALKFLCTPMEHGPTLSTGIKQLWLESVKQCSSRGSSTNLEVISVDNSLW